MPTTGQKSDAGKPQWDLLPMAGLIPVIRVLEFGAKKYAPENWRKVPDLQRRYLNAAQRHLAAAIDGETCDSESNFPHIAHAVCCLLFKLALDPHQSSVTETT